MIMTVEVEVKAEDLRTGMDLSSAAIAEVNTDRVGQALTSVLEDSSIHIFPGDKVLRLSFEVQGCKTGRVSYDVPTAKPVKFRAPLQKKAKRKKHFTSIPCKGSRS